MEMSSSIAELAAALATAQATIAGAAKDKANPAFKSKYADLSSVWDAWQAVGPAQGLSVTQLPGTITDGKVTLTTVLAHKSGEWMRETLSIPVTKQDAQGYGSALTYARRYALSAFVGIAPEDDDANAAVGPQRGRSEPAQAPVVGPWPEGPYTAKTNLMTAYKEFVRNLHGMADADDVEGAIEDAKPMLAQFRAAAKAGILQREYQGGGDFLGVMAELAAARGRIAANAGVPNDPGPVAGQESMAADVLRKTLEDCRTIPDLKRWFKSNEAMLGEQPEAVRDELRDRFRQRDAGMRLTENMAA